MSTRDDSEPRSPLLSHHFAGPTIGRGSIVYSGFENAFIERAEWLIEIGMSEIDLYSPTIDMNRPVL